MRCILSETKTAPKGSVWYDSVPVGIHTLQQTVTKMCKKTGFVGYYTNHSLRASAATCLYAAGVDDQLIAEKTGHRSSAIRAYKHTSEEQQQSVSDLTTVSASESKKVKSNESVSLGSAKEIKITAGDVTVNLKPLVQFWIYIVFFCS